MAHRAGPLVLVVALLAAGGLGAAPPPSLFASFGTVGAGDDAAWAQAAPQLDAPRRLVQVEWALLEQARQLVELRGEAALLFNLSDATALPIIFEYGAPTKSGYSLAGRVADAQGGRVVLTVQGELLAGAVWTPQAQYRIRARGGGLHSIERVDAKAALPLAEPRIPTLGRRRAAETEVPAQAKDGMAQIDLLALWTPAARRLAGGLRQIQAHVDLSVAVANDAYAAGGVEQRLRLVGAAEVNYENETIDDIDNRLPETDDGFLDELHAIRDSYAADLVSLFVKFEVGGVALLMTELTEEFASSALSMVDVRAEETVLAHELGHNMGLQHDRYALPASIPPDVQVALFPYGFGYVNQRAFGGGSPCWQTIMAYPDQCQDAGFDAVGIPRFSNPEQRYPSLDGDPLGVSIDRPVVGWDGRLDGPTHAVRSLNEARHVVAGFRDGTERCAYALSVEEVNLPTAGGAFSVRVDTDDGCPWSAHHQSAFLSLAAGSANTGSGEVTYQAQPNDGLARAGVASIGGETIAVRQLGAVAPVPACQRTPAVRDAIAAALSGKTCEAVTVWDLLDVTALALRSRSVTALRFEDFDGLTNLWRLELHEAVTDLAPLRGLANLWQLSLLGNGIADLSPLANLVQLEYLDLNDNAVADLSPLAGFTRLQLLFGSRNQIEDLTPLAGLTGLRSLELTDNAISDVSSLAGLGNLFVLLLDNNQVADISALADMHSLFFLGLSGNAVTDISPLLALGGLTQVDLRGNPLSDAAIDLHIPMLQARGVFVLFDAPDVPPRRPLWWWLLQDSLAKP